MKFSFKNLGIIKQADIELNGLTVLTGLNDTGKSFISKGIYSIIKSFNESILHVDRKKYTAITNAINQINLYHRQTVAFTPEKVQKFNAAPLLSKTLEVFVNKVGTREELKLLIDTFKQETIDDMTAAAQSNPGSAINIKARLPLIKQAYELINSNLQDISNEEKFKLYFEEEIIQKSFQAQIITINSENIPLVVSVSEGETMLVDFSVAQNKVQISTSNYSSILPSFKNATIIETPIIVSLERYITFTLAYAQQPQGNVELPNHYIDICRKISSAKANTKVAEPIFNILKQTKEIIGGQVLYNQEQGGIVFMKDNGLTIRVNNMATGIKSFGLLQMLLNSDVINQTSLLIIDEPEVHLHPRWEIEYAKIIVALCKAGVPILISSHSPYLLEALSVFIKEANIEDISKFYYGDKEGSSTTIFKDVTNNLEPIFNKLAEPMERLFLKSNLEVLKSNSDA